MITRLLQKNKRLRLFCAENAAVSNAAAGQTAHRRKKDRKNAGKTGNCACISNENVIGLFPIKDHLSLGQGHICEIEIERNFEI